MWRSVWMGGEDMMTVIMTRTRTRMAGYPHVSKAFETTGITSPCGFLRWLLHFDTATAAAIGTATATAIGTATTTAIGTATATATVLATDTLSCFLDCRVAR
ncbi:hypothetical protein ACMFMG_004997 [Clarireedia jacksonii]